jgi:hypothetical protein
METVVESSERVLKEPVKEGKKRKKATSQS